MSGLNPHPGPVPGPGRWVIELASRWYAPAAVIAVIDQPDTEAVEASDVPQVWIGARTARLGPSASPYVATLWGPATPHGDEVPRKVRWYSTAGSRALSLEEAWRISEQMTGKPRHDRRPTERGAPTLPPNPTHPSALETDVRLCADLLQTDPDLRPEDLARMVWVLEFTEPAPNDTPVVITVLTPEVTEEISPGDWDGAPAAWIRAEYELHGHQPGVYTAYLELPGHHGITANALRFYDPLGGRHTNRAEAETAGNAPD